MVMEEIEFQLESIDKKIDSLKNKKKEIPKEIDIALKKLEECKEFYLNLKKQIENES